MSPWEARAASCGAAQAPLWTRWLVLAAVATDGTLVVLACARHLLVRVACFSAGRRRRRRRRCVGSRRRRRQPERWRVLGHPLLLLATLRLVKDNEHLRRSLHPHARPHPPHQHAVANLEVDVRHHVLSRHLGGRRDKTPRRVSDDAPSRGDGGGGVLLAERTWCATAAQGRHPADGAMRGATRTATEGSFKGRA